MPDDTAPTMPEAEAAHVAETYKAGRVILEYGSGGTTRLAAGMPGKLIFSVESDLMWALDLQAELDAAETASPVMVYHSDIGETGKWGRPILSETNWRGFHRFALDIWDQPFFRAPDVVLIDGRLRMACLGTVMMYTDRPVTVLFDDYVNRPMYQVVERLVTPTRTIGRMAQFDIVPDMIAKTDMGFLISLFSTMSVYGGKEVFYAEKTMPWQRSKAEAQPTATEE
jgi:hypothetical protein